MQDRIVHIGGKFIYDEETLAFLIPGFLKSTNYLEIGLQGSEKGKESAQRIADILQACRRPDTMIAIHAPHWRSGFNPSACSDAIQGLSAFLLRSACQMASDLNAPVTVVHTGFMELNQKEKIILANEGLPALMENSDLQKRRKRATQRMGDFFKRFLKENPQVDPRTLYIENCPMSFIRSTEDEVKAYLTTAALPAEMKSFCEDFNFSFTLDLAHGWATGNQLEEDPRQMTQEFLGIKKDGRGIYFHLSGMNEEDRFDGHTHLADSDHSYVFLEDMHNMLPKPAPLLVTLETFQHLSPKASLKKIAKDVGVVYSVIYKRHFTPKEAVHKLMQHRPKADDYRPKLISSGQSNLSSLKKAVRRVLGG